MLKDIISKSEYYGSANNVEHNKFSRFEYYSSNIKFNGEIEQIWVNVGISKFDKSAHLYAITPKRE
nr:MAG TPA: hypothetical protein [Caudoviricetes sp.]